MSKPEYPVDHQRIRILIESASDGFLSPEDVAVLLEAAGIPRVYEQKITKLSEIEALKKSANFPVVMKVVGPVHKTDVGGVVLNIHSIQEMKRHFKELMKIDHATAVLVQPMISGRELFIGVQRESNFGHLIFCGLGGIFIEVLNDFSARLSPVGKSESVEMIKHLRAYKLIRGTRGKEGVNEEIFSEIIQRLSALVESAPEIAEMDINPLMGSMNNIAAVDSRIRIEK